MKRLPMFIILVAISTIIHCSKPCKTPDMSDLSISVDMAIPVDMFCQVNPATELCFDFRPHDK